MLGKESGDTFCKAATMQLNMNERDEAASSYINASKSFKKCSPQGKKKTLASFSYPAVCLCSCHVANFHTNVFYVD